MSFRRFFYCEKMLPHLSFTTEQSFLLKSQVGFNRNPWGGIPDLGPLTEFPKVPQDAIRPVTEAVLQSNSQPTKSEQLNFGPNANQIFDDAWKA